jgi:hypothetical protein
MQVNVCYFFVFNEWWMRIYLTLLINEMDWPYSRQIISPTRQSCPKLPCSQTSSLCIYISYISTDPYLHSCIFYLAYILSIHNNDRAPLEYWLPLCFLTVTSLAYHWCSWLYTNAWDLLPVNHLIPIFWIWCANSDWMQIQEFYHICR